MKPIIYICLIIILALATASNCWAGQTEHELLRKQARQAFNDGNWQDAYLVYQQLCLEVVNDPKLIGHDLVQAWQCLRNLNRLSELDAFREEVIDKHSTTGACSGRPPAAPVKIITGAIWWPGNFTADSTAAAAGM